MWSQALFSILAAIKLMVWHLLGTVLTTLFFHANPLPLILRPQHK